MPDTKCDLEKFPLSNPVRSVLIDVFGLNAFQRIVDECKVVVTEDRPRVHMDDDGNVTVCLPRNATFRQVVHEFAHAYSFLKAPELMERLPEHYCEAIAIIAEVCYYSPKNLKGSNFSELCSGILNAGQRALEQLAKRDLANDFKS